LDARLGISSPIGRIEALVPIVMGEAVEIEIPEVAPVPKVAFVPMAFMPEVALVTVTLVAVSVPAVALTAKMAPTIVFGTNLVLIALVSAISAVVLSVPSEGSSGHH
jgi:hypothetical protein